MLLNSLCLSGVGRSLRILSVSVLIVSVAGCGVGAESGEDESFYAGQNVDLVVPYDPGGGYDVYARALAPFLGQCLDAQIVVRNEPGAGGLVATSRTAVAESDEPRLQILNMGGFASAQIAEAEGVQYDLTEFSYAGRMATNIDLLATAPGSPYQSFSDVLEATEPVKFVATGPGSLEAITPSVLAAAYDFPLEIITGFEGSDEARTAVIAGNADMHALPYDSHLAAVESGDVKGVVAVGDESLDALPEVPPISEFPSPSDEAQGMVDSLVALGELGRSIAGPPGMSEAQLSELQQGFDCAMNNKTFLRQMEEQQRPIAHASGEAVLTQLKSTIDGVTPQFEKAVREGF